MQNSAIRTLKAIREIHNEPHQWQVHVGDWYSEMTQTTWQFEAPSAISILATAAVNIGRVPAVVCCVWGGFLKNICVDLDAGLEWSKHGAPILTVQGFLKCLSQQTDTGWRAEQWAWIVSLHFATSDFSCVIHEFLFFFFCESHLKPESANFSLGW